jgi:ankyrin repeat protein
MLFAILKCKCKTFPHDCMSQSGKTALHWASSKGYLEIAKELVKYGAELDLQDEVINVYSSSFVVYTHIN